MFNEIILEAGRVVITDGSIYSYQAGAVERVQYFEQGGGFENRFVFRRFVSKNYGIYWSIGVYVDLKVGVSERQVGVYGGGQIEVYFFQCGDLFGIQVFKKQVNQLVQQVF